MTGGCVVGEDLGDDFLGVLGFGGVCGGDAGTDDEGLEGPAACSCPGFVVELEGGVEGFSAFGVEHSP